MTVGLAFFYGGLEPQRNVLNMLIMNFFTIAIVTVVWDWLDSRWHLAQMQGLGLSETCTTQCFAT